MIRASIVGTRNECVTRSRRATSSHPSGLNDGSGTTRRPAYVEVRVPTTPATWNGGAARRFASSPSAEPNSVVVNTYDVRWSCRSTAALGAADVPLVYSRTAGRSGSSGKPASLGAGAVPSHSSVVAVTAGCSRSISSSTTDCGSR